LTYGLRIVTTSTPVRFNDLLRRRGQPSLCSRDGPAVGAVMEPQEIQDEAHEQVLDRVAAVDVAKASGMVHADAAPVPARRPADPGVAGGRDDERDPGVS
jgi:hypothetical protein